MRHRLWSKRSIFVFYTCDSTVQGLTLDSKEGSCGIRNERIIKVNHQLRSDTEGRKVLTNVTHVSIKKMNNTVEFNNKHYFYANLRENKKKDLKITKT